MIIRSSKASSETLRRVSTLVLSVKYSDEVFPNLKETEKLAKYLHKLGPEWNIFTANDTVALLSMFFLDQVAVIEELFLSNDSHLQLLIADLQSKIREAKINTLFLKSPVDQADSFEKLGLTKRTNLVRLSGKIRNTNIMPVLPLASPTLKEIPGLSKLLYDANAKSSLRMFPTQVDAERRLNNILSGAHGSFLADASFTSGMPEGNIVSACLVTTRDERNADLVELFTHPLYRARGLATVEISTAMNRLAARNFSNLHVWISEGNETAKRLFAKLGFKPDREATQFALSAM